MTRTRIWLPVLWVGCAWAGPAIPAPPDFPASPPEAPPLRPAELPPVTSEQLDNGMEVVVISNDEVPWVSATWFLPAGAKFDPPQQSGLAMTTAALLRQGTENYTADALAELLDFHAIKLGGSAGYEKTFVHAGSLARNVGQAVACLADVVRRPVFADRALGRHLEQQINEMKMLETAGCYRADCEFRRRLYGQHYLGRMPEGNSDTLPRIGRGDVVGFHKRHYMPNASVLVFSGAIDSRRALSLAKKHFGDWQPGRMPACPTAAIPPRSQTRIYLVNRPEATQSHIRIGQVGFRRSDPEYLPAQVFNEVLGGSFKGRLHAAIRMKEGLCSDAQGQWLTGRQPGHLRVATATGNETTAETLRTMLRVIRSMATRAPSPEELSDAKSFITGRFGLSLETPQAAAEKVFELKFHGLPHDYFKSYLQQVNSLSSSDVVDFARGTTNLDQLTIVVVGTADEFRDELARIAPVVAVEGQTGPCPARTTPVAK